MSPAETPASAQSPVAPAPHEPSASRSDPSSAADGGATRSAASWIRFAGVAIAGLSLDLWSKEWAFHTLLQNGRRVLIPNVLEFQTMLNAGALFGIGKGQTILFVIASLVALLLVVRMFASARRSQALLHVALGAILAGALGNMYDRIFIKLAEKPVAGRGGNPVFVTVGEREERGVPLREYPDHPAAITRFAIDPPPEVGYVRDFIKISQKWFGGRELWPWVFNVADMLLVGGVGVLAWNILRPPRRMGSAAAA